MKQATEPRKPARDRILDTAAELFYRDGIRAVGIDTVIARSGVAKMSLYRNFASKDDLVCAYLERSAQGYARWWQRMAERHPDNPKALLKGVFVSIGHWIAHPDFRGCPFTNAATELRDPDSPARALAVAQKRAVRERLRALAAAAGADNPDQLATHLQVLMEGAYAAAHTLVIDGNADAVATAAAALIDAACGQNALEAK
ncbi:TetR/AcrR family transcriptional regulator [Azospirillum griseum]|uniref:TetR/AcrR family transcriptional regulator n=1 Tax=Azospirillum griseum TaxID=2496639 RepID=A0A431VNG2_9PROT|nr:TetR/AcrR family transcriptional regulator [Azospirillum griseum]RTR24295.1 TetR/AcrR family transcriptional regulator [Azospirillum griseum]